MKRLIFYSFYDEEGIADNYTEFQLRAFRPFAREICVVVNGSLGEESYKKFEKLTDKILIRENKGFDAYGYKYAVETYGYEKLKEYDELLCFNHTCYGPILPLDDMFNKMDNMECDFWGLYNLTAPRGEKYNHGIHIPSYFVAYRNRLIASDTFKEYWMSMPKIDNYDDAVLFHEQRQTPYFEQAGFKKGTAFDFEKYPKLSEWWFIEFTAEFLIDEHLPLLKRRPFFKDKKGRIDVAVYRKIIPYIIKETNYDVNLIWENLERTQKITELEQPSLIKILSWKILFFFALITGRNSKKFKKRLDNIITKDEILKLFNKSEKSEK